MSQSMFFRLIFTLHGSHYNVTMVTFQLLQLLHSETIQTTSVMEGTESKELNTVKNELERAKKDKNITSGLITQMQKDMSNKVSPYSGYIVIYRRHIPKLSPHAVLSNFHFRFLFISAVLCISPNFAHTCISQVNSQTYVWIEHIISVWLVYVFKANFMTCIAL